LDLYVIPANPLLKEHRKGKERDKQIQALTVTVQQVREQLQPGGRFSQGKSASPSSSREKIYLLDKLLQICPPCRDQRPDLGQPFLF